MQSPRCSEEQIWCSCSEVQVDKQTMEVSGNSVEEVISSSCTLVNLLRDKTDAKYSKSLHDAKVGERATCSPCAPKGSTRSH